MPEALEPPPAPFRDLRRLAPRARASTSLPSLAHTITQRLLDQHLETLKMEQKIAEMKPSKRYAYNPSPSPRPVKPHMMLNKWESLRGNNAEKKQTLDVRLLIHWLDHGLRTWCRTFAPTHY